MHLIPLSLRQQLSSLFMSANATDALCGPELFTAFAAPGNESAILRQLQTSVCSANATVMMWQAVMGQASGYQLYQQVSCHFVYRLVQKKTPQETTTACTLV